TWFAPPTQRPVEDTAVEEARSMIARNEIGNPDTTLCPYEVMADLLFVIDEQQSRIGDTDELKADVKAADERADAAEKREKEWEADASVVRGLADGAQQAARQLGDEVNVLSTANRNLKDQLVMAIRANEELTTEIQSLRTELTLATSRKREAIPILRET